MTEEIFERELERRAGDVSDVRLTLGDVRGRARQIRRRRRAAAASVVAAAVALVALAPTLLSGGNKASAPDPAPPRPTAPGSSVLHNGGLTLPNGEIVQLDVDNADVEQIGVLSDGRIVIALSNSRVIRVYEPDGSEADYGTPLNMITMSTNDDAVAWIGPDLKSRILASGAADPITMAGVPMPGESYGVIDAVLGPEHILAGDFNTTGFEITPGQRQPLVTSEPFRITDVSPDGTLWSVRYADDEANPQYGCVGLYDPEAGEMVARSCDTSDLQFSPDGQHLLGGYFENNMAGEVVVYDLDLEEVTRYSPEGDSNVVGDAAWADATHVLASRTDWQTNEWELVRIGLDGETETVVPTQSGRNPENVDEFVFSE